MKNEKTYELVLTALFTAIIVIMAFTPLGYIPLVVINATVIHIPVILGALFLGPRKGAFLGFVFQQHIQSSHRFGICIFAGSGSKCGRHFRRI